MPLKKYGSIKLTLKNGVPDCAACHADQLMVLRERPVIYIYYSEKAFYVGQTNQFIQRYHKHLNEKELDFRQFDAVLILYGQYVDGNSLNDLERRLITYLTVDNQSRGVRKKRAVLNRTLGNRNPDYSNKEEVYTQVLVPFWTDEMHEAKLTHELSLSELRRSILFKYSPFIELSEQQAALINEIVAGEQSFLVQGTAGTGKTVVLTNLVADLCAHKEKQPLKIGVAVKSNWRKKAKRILKAYGIDAGVTIGSAYNLIKGGEHYDVIIVDEAHRLRWNYGKQISFTCDIFSGRDPYDNELSLLGAMSDRLILLYDALQAIRPSDILRHVFDQYIQQHNFEKRILLKQFRVQINDPGATYTADDYINGICSILQLNKEPYNRDVFKSTVPNAYFGVVDSVAALFAYVNEQRQYRPTAQCRVLAGYARPWGSKYKPTNKKYLEFDWVEDSQNRWRWNSTHEDWLSKTGSENEIGSIHAVQGLDLDYVGVVIAKDITVVDGKVVAVKENYYDQNGTPKKEDFTLEGLTEYIKQIYYVLLTRGIRGIRVYFEDKALREYFMKEVGLS